MNCFLRLVYLYILIWYADPRSKSHQFDSWGALSNTQRFSQVNPKEINLKGEIFQPKKEENSHWEYSFMEISNLITVFLFNIIGQLFLDCCLQRKSPLFYRFQFYLSTQKYRLSFLCVLLIQISCLTVSDLYMY